MLYGEFLESHKVMLAPMAGVSDVAFRQLCVEQGAALAFCEMVSAKGLSYANERTRELLRLAPGEEVVGVQLFGHDSAVMADQARWVQEALGEHLAVIDINMGCPVRKIAGKGDGAALMNDLELAGDIVRSVADAVEVPVSVKTRRGYYADEPTCVRLARIAEDSGASAVCIHGRYATQMYAGTSDWGCIAEVKSEVGIPVIGNGDVFSAEDAASLIEHTGCDAVMVARGAQGNPWIFSQANALLSGKEAVPFPTDIQRIETGKTHARLLAQLEPKLLLRMRKHACWYVKGIKGASQSRRRFSACTTLEQFEEVFDDLSEAVLADRARG